LGKANIQVLIAFLKKKQAEGSARRVSAEDIAVGDWIKKFTDLETNPRTGINTSKNQPFRVILWFTMQIITGSM
jgi:hypothetical protein